MVTLARCIIRAFSFVHFLFCVLLKPTSCLLKPLNNREEHAPKAVGTDKSPGGNVSLSFLSTRSANQGSSTLPKRHPPLRFVFSGYSIWLELEQQEIDEDGRGDLDRAVIDAANEFHLGGAIPSPHVTALYGIGNDANEGKIRRVFREDVKKVLSNSAEERRQRDGKDEIGKMWPDLDATGIHVGTEFDGVNGGEMDMAWAEVTFATSSEHEALLDALYNLFYCSSDEEKKEERPSRANTWAPHLSLCYDNPEGFGPNLSRVAIENYITNNCPTLEKAIDKSDNIVTFSRAVNGISLWKTAGTMSEWKCLDKIQFPLG